MVDFDLGKQIGPLPLGVWIAVGAGGLGIAWFINRGGGGGDDRIPVTERGVGEGGGQFVEDPPQQGSGSPGGQVETNRAWGQRAQNFLIAQGHDPGLSDNAVRKYLMAASLNSQEQALINLVLAEFGAPPEPLPPTEVPGDDTQLPVDERRAEDDPRLVVNLEPTPVNRGATLTATGRAYYENREIPSGRRVVHLTVWNANYRPGLVPLSRSNIQTDEAGNFRYKLGWTNPDRGNTYRYYSFTWQGVSKMKRVRVVESRNAVPFSPPNFMPR